MDNIRKVLIGLAGIQEKSYEKDKVEMWNVPYFKFQVLWNDKIFTIVYEDKSSDGGKSNVAHTFKDGNISLSLIQFYDMIKEVVDGLQNSQLAEVGNNFTEQDIRDSKELSTLLLNKVDTLLEIIYESEDLVGELSELKDNEIYLLIKIDEQGHHIDGFTRSDLTARKYMSQSSFKQDYNKEEYPKYVYKVLREYE